MQNMEKFYYINRRNIIEEVFLIKETEKIIFIKDKNNLSKRIYKDELWITLFTSLIEAKKYLCKKCYDRIESYNNTIQDLQEIIKNNQ